MATDFFERQAAARRNTTWLVAMFVLSVIALVGATVIITAVGVEYGRQNGYIGNFDRDTGVDMGRLPLLAGVAALTLIVVGTVFKMAQLSAGGTGVAERLGGRRIYPNTTDLTERRVLNVVEEMALASGIPVPPVFLLMNEQGVNAFAAGFSPSDAVIGVTQGCADQLSRDQLQGVIAHEFSHILNGDMRLNLRLIGVLNGILVLGLAGKMLFRYGGEANYYRSDSRRGSGLPYLIFVGLALVILGSLGSLLGNLIKAAVSRQREFLADASAVQFTRNPGGIAGALKRIGSALFGSQLVAPAAAEASHMYFSQGVWAGITGLMATHPPLDERIHRIEPEWDGIYPPPVAADVASQMSDEALMGLTGEGQAPAVMDAMQRAKAAIHVSDNVANPTELHRQYAAELVAAMPPEVVTAAHEPYGARALIFAALLDRDADVRSAQLEALEQSAEPNVFELTLRLVTFVGRLDPRAWLPLVDMTLPALRSLSKPQYQEFMRSFDALVRADQRLSLFEWTLHKVLLRNLRPQFEPIRPQRTSYYGLQRLSEPVSMLVSMLARASQANDELAFQAAAQRLAGVTLRLLPKEECGLNQLDSALEQLAETAPQLRRQLVDACAAAICADGLVNVPEAELLRGICDLLDCPLPPLLPGQPIKPLAA